MKGKITPYAMPSLRRRARMGSRRFHGIASGSEAILVGSYEDDVGVGRRGIAPSSSLGLSRAMVASRLV